MRWSMKRYPACAIVVFLLALPAVSAAQSEKVAFYALKKMEARLEKPISLREYSRLLKETKSSVDPYLRTSEAGTDGDMSLLMANVMSHYGNIGFIRKEAIMGPYIHLDPARVRMYSAKSIAKARNFSALMEQYPEAGKPVEGGVRLIGTLPTGEGISISSGTDPCWTSIVSCPSWNGRTLRIWTS